MQYVILKNRIKLNNLIFKYNMSLIQPLITLVNQIPHGRVLSYGRLAEQLNIITGETTSGWSVGRLLSRIPTADRAQLPWHRVINKQWYISSLKLWAKWLEQIRLLKEEWVEVNNEWYVDMVKYEWSFPRSNLFG